jgi:exosome complex component RRP42
MSEIYKIVSEIEKNQIINKLEKGKRIDGRAFDQYREWKLETNVVSKAEGSARVELGNTKVIVGIKAEIGEPYPDSPKEGVATVMAELIPMAHPTFEPGPPGFDAVELARVVDRGIRHSDLIDREKLCIVPGEKVWILFIDVYVIDYDGNLFDASSMAAVAALLTAKLPEVKIEGDDLTIDIDKKNPLPLKGKVGAVTTAKIGNYLMIDPDGAEERIMDGRITVAFNEKGEISSIQKGGSSSFKLEEIQKAIELSKNASKKIIDYLAKVI